MKACFEPGGCYKPTRIIRNKETNQIIRLNIGFNLVSIFSSNNHQPFNLEDITEIPEVLKEHGVTFEQWKEKIDQFITILSSRRSYFSTYFSLLCCFQCSRYRHEVLETNQRLSEWEENFNRNYLENKGIYCKIQSHSLQLRDRIFSHWIAFSFDRNDIEVLKKEPHLFGSIQDWSCCGGVNEHELCCHPL